MPIIAVLGTPVFAIALGWLAEVLRRRRTVGLCRYCERDVLRRDGTRYAGLTYHWRCWSEQP